MGFLNFSKQQLLSVTYKGLNVLCTLLVVRFAIQFAGEETYGIWLALLSFITWFSALESGITNAIRNKITTYFADKKFVQLRQIIGQGYLTLSYTYLSALVLMLVGVLFFDLDQLLVPADYDSNQLKIASSIAITFYFIYFALSFLNAILLSTHQPAVTYLITLIQNLITLSGILFLEYSDTEPTLLIVCVWLSITPLLTALSSSLVLYRTKLNHLVPVFEKGKSFIVDKKNRTLLYSFLSIQVCTLIIYSTDNLIIVNYLSGEEVTKFNIAFRYFNLITVLFNLILLPYWASFAEAFHQKDNKYIKNSIRKLVKFWSLLMLLSIVMVIASHQLYQLWLGYEIEIPLSLSVFTALSIALSTWYTIFSYFLNSINEVSKQRNWLILSAAINLVLSIVLIQLMGTTGVIIATCIALLPLSIALPIQYKKLIAQLD